MIKTTEDIIYNRIKDKIGFHKSPKFLKFIGDKNPEKVLHHAFGSYSQSKKTSDYAVIPVTLGEHERAEKNKSQFAIDNLHIILNQLIDYIESQEQEISELKHIVKAALESKKAIVQMFEGEEEK